MGLARQSIPPSHPSVWRAHHSASPDGSEAPNPSNTCPRPSPIASQGSLPPAADTAWLGADLPPIPVRLMRATARPTRLALLIEPTIFGGAPAPPTGHPLVGPQHVALSRAPSGADYVTIKTAAAYYPYGRLQPEDAYVG